MDAIAGRRTLTTMPETLFALALYALTASITPGPNNIMVTASGANFGFRRTLPHMLGIAIGFGAMIAAIGLGLGAIFLASPTVQTVMKAAGIVYTLWLAWKIAKAGGPGDVADAGRPMTFLGAALFQWVNVKAWIMSVGAVAVFSSPGDGLLASVGWIVLVFFLASLPSVAIWTMFGVALRRALRDPTWLRVFNVTMALLLVASIVPLMV